MPRPAKTRKSTEDAAPTREDLAKAELEVGKNIPEGMIGLDTEDVGDVEPRH